MRIDTEEIRFWIRKLGKPKHQNHAILDDLIEEIPAFLYYLKSMPVPDFSKSRMVLTPEQINNEYLEAVKSESRTWLYKELRELFEDYFSNEGEIKDEIYCRPADIKSKFFYNNHQVQINYIRRVMKEEFGLTTQQMQFVSEYDSLTGTSFRGRPFCLKKGMFLTEKMEEMTEKMPF